MVIMIVMMLGIFEPFKAPLVLVDYFFYQKWTLVPFNLVMYNVWNSSSESGPDIFGTEPWWFYLVNGVLNWSLVWVSCLFSGAMVVS